MQNVADGSAIHIFHDDITARSLRIITDIQNIDDVRIADGTRQLRLLHEPFYELAAPRVQLAGEHLRRAENSKRLMSHQVDAAHSALSQLLDDHITVETVARLKLVPVPPRRGGGGQRLMLKHGHIRIVPRPGRYGPGSMCGVRSRIPVGERGRRVIFLHNGHVGNIGVVGRRFPH